MVIDSTIKNVEEPDDDGWGDTGGDGDADGDGWGAVDDGDAWDAEAMA